MRQKGFVSTGLVSLLIVVIVVVSYLVVTKRPTNEISPRHSSTPVDSKSTPTSQLDNCDLLRDSTFVSVNKYEVGLGPDGAAMGYWSVVFEQAFKQAKFSWHHSDITESGTYSCKENVLQVEFPFRSAIANYDGDRGILVWEGVEYKRVE